MNWDALGAGAEAVGAIGIIVTLVYLALQVRANTRAMSVQSRHQISEFVLQIAIFRAEHADRWAHVQFTAEENLTEGDKDFRYWTLMQFMLHAETYFHHHEMGMMPESHWRGYEGYFLENIIRSRGFDEFWAQTGPGWSENFRRWVDQKVSQK